MRQRVARVLYERACFVVVPAFGEYRDPPVSVCMAKDLTAVHVRGARPADRAAIEAVTLAAYQEYAAQMPEHWEAYRQNIVGTLGSVEPRDQLVAEREGKIVGCVLLHAAGSRLTGPAASPSGYPCPRCASSPWHPKRAASGSAAPSCTSAFTAPGNLERTHLLCTPRT